MKTNILCILVAIFMIACEPAAKTLPQDNVAIEFTLNDLMGKWLVCAVDSNNWLSINFSEKNLTGDMKMPDFHPWVTFMENNALGASVGCNGMGGIYTFKEGKLSIGECCQTEMYCYELDEYERTLFSFLYGDLSIEPYTKDSIILKRNENQIVLRRDQE